MVLAQGSKVVIKTSMINENSNRAEEVTCVGALSEEVNISLTTSYRDLFSEIKNTVTETVSVVAGVTRQLTGSGFSGKFKQMTTQVWEKTEPASFNLTVKFARSTAGGSVNVTSMNVLNIARIFCKVPLPREGRTGHLLPPGPSAIQGLGISWTDDVGNDKEKWVDVEVSGLKLTRLLMLKAEPTFCKYVDEAGYPLYCNIAFSFRTMWSATKKMVDGWTTGSW